MYDPWRYHLKNIADFYNGVSGAGRIWHHMWANVFKMIGINNIYIWAKIIHISQSFLAALCMYYFSKTVLGLLIRAPNSNLQATSSVIPACPESLLINDGFQTIQKEGVQASKNDEKDDYALRALQIKFLSLFSVLLWFIGVGTFSVAHQQAWIMWYSVTYQGLTMPLLWYSMALTIRMFYAKVNWKKFLFYSIQIAIVSVIIAKFHPLELLYYLISLPVILLINIKKILSYENKKVLLISITVLCVSLIITIKYFLAHQPTGFYALISSDESAGQIIQKITDAGRRTVKTLNRFPDSFSELAQISLILAVMFRIYSLFVKKARISFNASLFDCLLVLSIIFFLIPVVPFLAGVAGHVTIDTQVYRFFYVPPWFIFLPFFISLIIQENLISKIRRALSDNTFFRIVKEKEIEVSKRKLLNEFIVAGIVIIIVITVVFKNAFSDKSYILKQLSFKTTIQNTKSIINSLDKKKVEMEE